MDLICITSYPHIRTITVEGLVSQGYVLSTTAAATATIVAAAAGTPWIWSLSHYGYSSTSQWIRQVPVTSVLPGTPVGTAKRTAIEVVARTMKRSSRPPSLNNRSSLINQPSLPRVQTTAPMTIIVKLPRSNLFLPRRPAIAHFLITRHRTMPARSATNRATGTPAAEKRSTISLAWPCPHSIAAHPPAAS